MNKIDEKSSSVSQQQAAGVALSAKRGKIPASELFGAAKTMYDSMSTGELEAFASTKHAGLPDKAECTEPTAQTIAETIMGLAEEKKADYKIFFSNALKKFGVTSVKKLSGDTRKKFFKYVDDNWKSLDETSSSGGAGEYLTPRAFTGGTDAGKKKQKQTAELLGYKLVNNENADLNESFYFKDDSLTEEQKMNLAVRQIRNNLYEVEKLVGKTLKLKNESGIKSEEYGKRTYSALRRINEKVIRLMGSLQNFK